MPKLVTAGALTAFAPSLECSTTLGEDIKAARALMASRLDPAGLSEDLAYQIELRLAAHFATLSAGNLNTITKADIEGVGSETYKTMTSGVGLRSTLYGQAALSLDPTGLLDVAGKDKATLRFL